MEFLRKVYEERKEYFENFNKYLNKIKEILNKNLKEYKIYLFGSYVRGDYSIGLSDIDIAIVSEEFKDRDKKLEVFGILIKEFFNSPFEFHLLTNEQWEFYKRFIDKYKEV